MVRQRHYNPHKKKMRNLNQFDNWTDEEFDQWWEENYESDEFLHVDYEELERRIKEKLDQIANDYDLDDMKANDMMQLRALALSVVQLEDLENKAFELRQDINPSNVLTLEKVNRMISALKSDISSLSTDLQLTKKIRARSKEVSVAQRWQELTDYAYEFAKQKFLYVFCPDCHTLLATIWLLYTDKSNVIHLDCGKCGGKFDIELSNLYETNNKNYDNALIP